MSKYGSCVSMKQVIQLEMQAAEKILDQSGLSDENKDALRDILREMAYQWCSTNASFCAYEAAVEKVCGHGDAMQQIMAEQCKSGAYERKMRETYPW